MRERFVAIDGLRGLAILMVTIYHIWGHMGLPPVVFAGIDLTPLVRNGHLGVPLFFTLSGFCLYYPLVKKEQWSSWKQFYERRALRILPGYWLSLIVFFIPFAMWAGWRMTASHFLSHVTFTETFFFDHRLSVNAVWWSLAVEIHYYLIFPWLALLFKRYPYHTFAACMLISLLVRFISLEGYLSPWELWTTNLPARLCEFGTGMFVAYLIARMPHLLERRHVVLIAELLGVVVLCVMPFADVRNHGIERGFMSIGAH